MPPGREPASGRGAGSAVSRESQEIFFRELNKFRPGDDPAPLRAAAVGHLGASRPLHVLMEEYAAAMDGRENHNAEQHAAAQRIADEMTPITMARRVTAGLLPGVSYVVGGG